MMRSGIKVLGLALIALLSSVAHASLSQDRTVRELMCVRPKFYYPTKGKLKFDLNRNIAVALKAEGVGSLAALAEKARLKPLRYSTRTIMDDAIYIAAITENRSAFIDLASYEENLCRSKTKGACDEKLVGVLNDKDSFQKTVRDQYEYFQLEREYKGAPLNTLTPEQIESIPMSLMDSGATKAPATAAKGTLDPKALKDLGEMIALPTPKNINMADPNCVEKVAGALRSTYMNTSATNIIDRRGIADPTISSEQQQAEANREARNASESEKNWKRAPNFRSGGAR